MGIDFFIVIAVVALLSIVQSIFGMGILVFGTPTLMIIGYDFIPTLGLLLPASFAISLLQVLSAGKERPPVSKYLYLLCLPGIGFGLWLEGSTPVAAWSNILIGVMLLLSALVRFWPKAQDFLAALLKRQLPAYHLVMGIIHGLTNLGGALLAVLAGATQSSKQAIRSTVAHYYLAFSVIQMLFLTVVLGHISLFNASLPIAAVAAVVYLIIGRRIFALTSNPHYNRVLSVFIALYGIVILFR